MIESNSMYNTKAHDHKRKTAKIDIKLLNKYEKKIILHNVQQVLMSDILSTRYYNQLLQTIKKLNWAFFFTQVS